MPVKKPSLFSNLKFTNKDKVFGAPVGRNKKSAVDVFVETVQKQIKLAQYNVKPAGDKPEGRAWFKKDLHGIHLVFRYGTMPFALLDGQSVDQAVTVASYEELIELLHNVEAVASEKPFSQRIEDAAVKMVAEREEAKIDPVKLEKKRLAKEKKAAKDAAEAVKKEEE